MNVRLKKVRLAKNRYGISHDGGGHWEFGALEYSQLKDRVIQYYIATMRRAILKIDSRFGNKPLEDLPSKAILPIPHEPKAGDVRLPDKAPSGAISLPPRRVCKYRQSIPEDQLQDMLQNGLCKLLEAIQGGLPMPHVLARYCRRIGINLALDYLRKLKTTRRNVDIESVEIAIDPIDLIDVKRAIRNGTIRDVAEHLGCSKSELHRVLVDVG